MPAARTTVVIVTYLSRGTIAHALEPLRGACERGDIVCVVVDNASPDGTATFVREAFPFVRVIESGGNLGFGKGCNLGAKGCQTEFLLLLNPDAAMSFDAIQRLHAFMDVTPNAGIVGPAFENQEQHAGMLTRPWDVVQQAWGRPGYPEKRLIVPGDAPFRTTWICGAAMLIRTRVFQQLGGFDPRFFLYFEETDLCRRCVANGQEVWAVPEAVARHESGASARQAGGQTYAGSLSTPFFQSRFYYLTKHHGALAAVATDLLELLPLAARVVLRPGKSGQRYRGWLRSRLSATILRPPPP